MNDEPLSSEELQRLNILRRLKMLKETNGLAAYRPHKKQDMFHRAGKYKFRLLRTGNRFGKSTCGAAEDAAWAVGARLWVDKDDPLYTLGMPKRATKGLILCADWDKAREIFTSEADGDSKGKLMAMLPKDSILHRHKNQAGEVDCIEVACIWGGASTIYLDTIRSFMSNPMGQESSHWDWIHVDEPIPKAMWEANSRGLMDKNGSAWFTCTPISEGWITDMFVPNRNLRDSFDEGFESPGGSEKLLPKGTAWTMTGSTVENSTLSKEAIAIFSAQLSPEDRAARLEGHPRNLAGSIYKEFDRAMHEYQDLPIGWDDFDSPPANYTIRVSIDPHPKTPHAVLFTATAPTGQTFVYHEIFEHMLIESLCEKINCILAGRSPTLILCDPSAFVADPVHGTQWADEFYRCGVNVTPAPKDLKAGIPAVQRALKHRDPKGAATLLFSSSMSRTLYEFDAYVWDPKKPDKPRDKDDHCMECLYRLVLSGLDYYNPQEDLPANFGAPMTFDSSLPTFDNKGWVKSLNRDKAA